MKSAAIIPARGGSKRLPGKNLERVGGKTLLSHAIDSARACDRIYVSTDCDSIAAEAHRCGAQVVQRPDHISTDTSTTEAAVEHWWRSVPASERPECIALVQCASLVIDDAASHLEAGLRLLEESGRSSVVAVSRWRHAPFGGRLRACEDGAPDWVPHLPHDARRPRTQDVRPAGFECGAWWLFTAEHWKTTQLRSGPDAKAYLFDEHAVVDIDTHADLALARVLWDARRRA